MKDTITILSLGAGVQSTTLALAESHGLIEPIDCAIFADTGDEPDEVYEHLERLRGMVRFPIHICRQGPSLGQEFIDHLNGLRPSAAQPPFYVKAPDLNEEEVKRILAEPEPKWEDFKDSIEVTATSIESGETLDLSVSVEEQLFNDAWNEWNLRRSKALNKDTGGMLWRKCTRDWKIVPIRRETRRLMQEQGAKHVRCLIGISTDERQRERESGVKYITNLHPLLDIGWSRKMCEDWLRENYDMKIPKSACVYCPYRSNAGWKWMKQNMPEAFEKACQYDDLMRATQAAPKLNGASVVGKLYVWRGYAPLREANFDNLAGQMDFGFEQECHGMCGY